jgi:hypothetical protein
MLILDQLPLILGQAVARDQWHTMTRTTVQGCRREPIWANPFRNAPA